MAMGDNAPQNIILDGGVAAGQLPGRAMSPGRQAPTGGDYGPSVVYQQAPDALKGWSYPKVACSTAAVVAQVLASLNSGSNISATHEQQSLMETDTAASPMYCAGPLQGPLSPALGYRPIHENVALPESRVVSTAVAPQLKQRKGVGKASLVRRYSKKSDARLPPKKQGRKGIPREHITVPMLMDGGYLDMPIQVRHMLRHSLAFMLQIIICGILYDCDVPFFSNVVLRSCQNEMNMQLIILRVLEFRMQLPLWAWASQC